jgi:hypothetical protein
MQVMLRKHTGLYCWIALAGSMLCVTLFAAQENQTVDPSSKVKTTAQDNKKPVLLKAPRVSTDAAVHSLAKNVTKQATGDKTPNQAADAAVVEFRPAESGSAGSSSTAVDPKTTKKGASKDFHGAVYGMAGATNPGTNAEGAAIGANSKSSKSAIFVETDRVQTSPPR